jgi:hypothetical protein
MSDRSTDTDESLLVRQGDHPGFVRGAGWLLVLVGALGGVAAALALGWILST